MPAAAYSLESAPNTDNYRTAARVRRAALICWAIALIAVSARLALAKNLNHTVFDIFTMAGRSWIAGVDYHANFDKLFRYSPTAAAFFAPWSLLPERAGEILWRWFGAGLLVWGIGVWVRNCLPTFDATRRWWVVLGSLPLAAMSVNNGQANIHLLACVLLATGWAVGGRWWMCAIALVGAVLLKLWPIAFAGLLIVCFPKKLGWRFAVALAIGALLPFVCQRPAYVVEMYRSWLAYLPTDTRTEFNLLFGNRDAWLLIRLLGDPLTHAQYRLLQAGVGLVMAAILWRMTRRQTRPAELANAALFFGVCWMLPFGPATESCTYSLAGPILAWCWFDPTRGRESFLERLSLTLAVVLLYIPLVANMTPYSRWIEAFAPQPLGVLCLLGRCALAGRPWFHEIAESRPAGEFVRCAA